MTNLERACKWLEDTLVKQVRQKRNLAWIEEQEVALTAILDEVYQAGVSSVVVGRLDAWQKVSAAERVDILRKKIPEPACTGTLVHDEFTRCPRHG